MLAAQPKLEDVRTLSDDGRFSVWAARKKAKGGGAEEVKAKGREEEARVKYGFVARPQTPLRVAPSAELDGLRTEWPSEPTSRTTAAAPTMKAPPGRRLSDSSVESEGGSGTRTPGGAAAGRAPREERGRISFDMDENTFDSFKGLGDERGTRPPSSSPQAIKGGQRR